jgi:hypothetical protein
VFCIEKQGFIGTIQNHFKDFQGWWKIESDGSELVTDQNLTSISAVGVRGDIPSWCVIYCGQSVIIPYTNIAAP